MPNENERRKQLVHNHLIYYDVAAEIMYLEGVYLKNKCKEAWGYKQVFTVIISGGQIMETY